MSPLYTDRASLIYSQAAYIVRLRPTDFQRHTTWESTTG